MTQHAVDFLKNVYNVSPNKISLIYHGAPSSEASQGKDNKKKLGLEDKKVLLTFGLLSRNKGLETVLHALPPVVKKYPDVVYIILGKTHPNVVKASGEEYRIFLHRLVKQYKLEENVLFHDHFVSNHKLFEYLTAIDIYITPYLDKDQITSGTLAYAVGAGAAILSTPYWHAEDLLAEGRGRLFDFGNHQELANILSELLGNPAELAKLRKKTYSFGQKTTWSLIGNQYLSILHKEVSGFKEATSKRSKTIDPQELPIFSLEHVQRLTDHMGIIQHAKYSVPNRKEGYCLDDNARALLMAAMAFRQKRNPTARTLISTYLSFIDYMQTDDGLFHNFLGPIGQYIDDVGSEDSFGRTLWALGFFIRYSLVESYAHLAKQIFEKAVPNIERLKTIRGKANCLIGLALYLSRFSSNEMLNEILRNLTSDLIKQYYRESSKQWRWFEPILSYDNGILPLSLLSSYRIARDEQTLQVARDSLDFLDQLVFLDDHLSIIGNEKWYRKEQERSQFAQQPLDVMSLVLLYRRAYFAFKKPQYLRKMHASFNWFLGDNDLSLPLYDPETKGCNDGLEKYGVNKNQGAESTLAYLISHLAVLSTDEVVILKEV